MNNLYLIVVNDGYGDQCGYTYKRRCEVARGRSRDVHWWRMVNAADRWLQRQDSEYEPASDAVKSDAVWELDHYYQQHIKEL